jgi:hypothetical protein
VVDDVVVDVEGEVANGVVVVVGGWVVVDVVGGADVLDVVGDGPVVDVVGGGVVVVIGTVVVVVVGALVVVEARAAEVVVARGADVVGPTVVVVTDRCRSRSGAGGKAEIGSSRCAAAMTSCQISAGIEPPVTRATPATSRIGAFVSANPTQTEATSWGVYPTNHASR